MAWIDSTRPNDSVVPYEVVAAAAGIGPHGPTRRTVQRDRLAIEMNVPAAWVERQHCQIAATAGAAQVDSPELVANPELTGFNCVKIGQYVYEDGAEFHGRHSCESVCCDNARRLEPELVEERSRPRNILFRATPPLHHGKRRRQRVHFRQLDVAVARDIALDSGIRNGILPRARACGIGARRYNSSDGVVFQRDAHTRVYERDLRR